MKFDSFYTSDFCKGCNGRFQHNEQQYLNYDGKAYCEVCYKEIYEGKSK